MFTVPEQNKRPTIPDVWRRTPEFYDLLRLCWHLTPRNRLRFPDIERRLQTLQEDLPADLIIDEREGKTVPIIDLITKLDETLGTQSMQDADLPITPRHEKAEQSIVTDSAWTLRDPSCRLSLLSTAYGELAQARRYERQYRTQLQHQFHRSRKRVLPLRYVPSSLPDNVLFDFINSNIAALVALPYQHRRSWVLRRVKRKLRHPVELVRAQRFTRRPCAGNPIGEGLRRLCFGATGAGSTRCHAAYGGCLLEVVPQLVE